MFRPAVRRSVPCHCLLWPWLGRLGYKLATKAPDAALVLMAAAAAALAAAEPTPAMPQAAGAGGPAARRDFYWLRSFLAGGGFPPGGPGRALSGRGGIRGRSGVCGRDNILGLWLLQCPARCLPGPAVTSKNPLTNDSRILGRKGLELSRSGWSRGRAEPGTSSSGLNSRKKRGAP